jgi:hypothetical protein
LGVFGVMIATWGTFMIGYTIYYVKNGNKKTKIKVFNLSDRAIKQKKYKDSLNERAKGMLK